MKAIEVGAAMAVAKGQPMNKFQSEVFIRLSMMGDQDTVIPDDANTGMAFRIMQARVKAAGIVAENRVLAFLSLLCDRPGTAVMYAAAIKWMASKKGPGRDVVVWNDVAEAFPWGFPSEADLEKIWGSQKVHDGKGSDNWLDRQEAWQ